MDESGTSMFNYTCMDTCMRQPTGLDYRGSLSRSRSGKTCALWREATKQEHSFLKVRLENYSRLYRKYFRGVGDIETTVHDTNYCRSLPWVTAQENVGPWCYVTANNSQLFRELCDVNYCPDAGKISKVQGSIFFPHTFSGDFLVVSSSLQNFLRLTLCIDFVIPTL